MSDFLERIAEETKARVADSKLEQPILSLEQRPYFHHKTHEVYKEFLWDDCNIIAEIKFASPSEGVIHKSGDPVAIAEGYWRQGARMLSVLTEPAHFKGDLAYLKAIRSALPPAPLLRKDFILDPYQITETKAYGADAVLLIVAMLDDVLLKDLFQQAVALGLTPLVETHNEAELDRALAVGARLIGVNNRNLKTLKVDMDTARQLVARKEKDKIFICESGLSDTSLIREMRARGYNGVLIGSAFMKQNNPPNALGALLRDLS